MFPIASNTDESLTYVNDVFSTYLYTGNGSTQTINNGIDLAGKGGLVWIKSTSTTTDHKLIDTARGATNALSTNTLNAQITDTNGLTSFSSTGFSIGTDSNYNTNLTTYVSWTFRKAAKFFDVVTWTGDGAATRVIPHSLGVTPGAVFIKRTDTGSVVWTNFHSGLSGGLTGSRVLFDSAAATAGSNLTAADSVSITVIATGTNTAGGTFVAYLFAHDTESTSVIRCGSWVDSGTGAQSITVGFEPQFLIYKRADATSSWVTLDTARSWPIVNALNTTANLYPHLNNATSWGNYQGNGPNATGFTIPTLASGATYIYIAIRRPNKPPTSGSQVYNSVVHTSSGIAMPFNAGFPPDLVISGQRDGGNNYPQYWYDRLRGIGNPPTGAALPYITSTSTAAETNTGPYFYIGQNGFGVNTSWSTSDIIWMFKRAPGFFDIVCYTGINSNAATVQSIAHSLGVPPELIITKARNDASNAPDWTVYAQPLGNQGMLRLQSTNGNFGPAAGAWNSTTPTSTAFLVGPSIYANFSGNNHVAYLFATLAGISKVGSYTGNGGPSGSAGTSQTINCGFAAGARFILIKCTSTTGDWFVWDTARGIVAANPHLSLNTNAAEVTTDDSIDPDNSGFIVNQVAATNVNVSSATYIFLAIA